MIPSVFVPVDEFPLTGSGKIDRKALPAPPETSAAALPPRRALEFDLQRIWSEVLGVARPGVHESFFELGGDSLLSIRLASALRRELGVSFDVPTFFAHPTIAAQADWIEQGGESSSTPVVLLRRGSADTPPLFLIHPALGLAFSFAPLVDRMAVGRTIYGLQSIGIEDGTRPLETIEEMAETYLEAITELQPEGPIALAGWSLGARIAYQAACRLDERGREVGFLGLIDATTWSRLDPALSVEEIVAQMFSDEFKLGDAGGAAAAPDLAKLGARLAVETGLSEAEVGRIVDVAVANLRALGQYRPPESRLGLTLFVSEELAAESTEDESLGWSAVAAGGVVTVALEGDHHSLLNPPHVDSLAAAIDRVLTRSKWLSESDEGNDPTGLVVPTPGDVSGLKERW